MLTVLQYSFFVMVSAYLIGAFGSLFVQKSDGMVNTWFSSFAAIGSLSGMILGIAGLMLKSVASFLVTTQLPLFSLSIHFDALSSFFVMLISIIAFLCSIYGAGYMRKFYGKYSLGSFGFFYNMFLLSLVLVVTAWNGFYFLFVWEIMSLASYFLVVFEHANKDNVRSGFVYLVMTHFATAFITIAFVLLFRSTGSFDFGVWRALGSQLDIGVMAIVFLSALIGFGTKAGIIPFHIWLPKAHPAAPSQVSALMSGVMIKTGIYMLMRLFLDLVPNIPAWSAYVILILGVISSLLGVLYALQEHDLKRLLAYHSVENIGIILLGFGGALVFGALNLKTLMVLGIVAALFHIANHAIFKTLLFFGSGSVLYRVHTRNIEEYGGLIKLMPLTAFTFLIGAAAISGLPPFNGFASEWLTFQSLFSGISGTFGVPTVIVFILAVASLALTGGLAALCFVKAFGATFLGRPRSREAEEARETSWHFILPSSVLALLCVLFGVFGSSVVGLLVRVSDSFRVGSSQLSYASNAISVVSQHSILGLTLMYFVLVVCVMFVAVAVRFYTTRRKVITARTWDCGVDLDSRMEITATGFSRSVLMIFGGILRGTRQTDTEYHDANIRYIPKSQVVTFRIEDVYMKYLYLPLYGLARWISERLKLMQSGNLNSYLLYILVALFLTFLWVMKD